MARCSRVESSNGTSDASRVPLRYVSVRRHIGSTSRAADKWKSTNQSQQTAPPSRQHEAVAHEPVFKSSTRPKPRPRGEMYLRRSLHPRAQSQCCTRAGKSRHHSRHTRVAHARFKVKPVCEHNQVQTDQENQSRPVARPICEPRLEPVDPRTCQQRSQPLAHHSKQPAPVPGCGHMPASISRSPDDSATLYAPSAILRPPTDAGPCTTMLHVLPRVRRQLPAGWPPGPRPARRGGHVTVTVARRKCIPGRWRQPMASIPGPGPAVMSRPRRC